MLWPFQVNGSWLAHTTVSRVVVTVLFTTTLSLATESQHAWFLPLKVKVPAAVMLWPFQVNGSWLAHTTVSRVVVTVLFTTTLSLATESQPAWFLPLKVKVPAAVML